MRNIKLLLTFMVSAFMFLSCSDDDENGNQVNVNFTFDNPVISELTFGEPHSITGNVVSTSGAITDLVFTGVEQQGDSYVAVGEEQSYPDASGSDFDFNMDYFVDNNSMSHIEVRAFVGQSSAVDYIEVNNVTGELQGSVYFDDITLMADVMVKTHDNTPEEFPNPGEGDGSDTPSFFSMHGVEVNGETKHVLNLSEARELEGEGLSMAFVNVLQNTTNKAYITSQRGYAFVHPAALGAGTVGRQSDLYEVNGKALRSDNYDATTFKVVNGSWNWEGDDAAKDQETFNLVDSIYLALGDEATTEAQRARAFYQLSIIQKRLDNATLGEEDDPTNLGAGTLARRRTNAGDQAGSAMVENFRAGDYIVLKSEKDGRFYYGIMFINNLYDDRNALVDSEVVAGSQVLDRELTEDLFLKPNRFTVRTQTAD